MKTELKLKAIKSLFADRSLDKYFIEAVMNFGWSEYFTDLCLEDLDDEGVDKCYLRCLSIFKEIPLVLIDSDIQRSFYEVETLYDDDDFRNAFLRIFHQLF